MKRIKSLLSVFVLTLAATACAGNSGENKKSNEPTKEDNKMEVVALNKADFLKKVYNYEANPNGEPVLCGPELCPGTFLFFHLFRCPVLGFQSSKDNKKC